MNGSLKVQAQIHGNFVNVYRYANNNWPPLSQSTLDMREMEAEVVVILTPLTNISSTQGWERHWTRYLGPPAVTDGTAEEMGDTNPIINIVLTRR